MHHHLQQDQGWRHDDAASMMAVAVAAVAVQGVNFEEGVGKCDNLPSGLCVERETLCMFVYVCVCVCKQPYRVHPLAEQLGCLLPGLADRNYAVVVIMQLGCGWWPERVALAASASLI